MDFEPGDAGFPRRVGESFARQRFMTLLGAELTDVSAGFCEIRLPYREDLTQQHGFFHGGVIATIADTAGGYAAYSLMGASDSVLTVEFKLNITAPGRGEYLIARGRVLRPGRTLSVTRAEVFGLANGVETLCAAAQQTMMRLADSPDRPDGPVPD